MTRCFSEGGEEHGFMRCGLGVVEHVMVDADW